MMIKTVLGLCLLSFAAIVYAGESQLSSSGGGSGKGSDILGGVTNSNGSSGESKTSDHRLILNIGQGIQSGNYGGKNEQSGSNNGSNLQSGSAGGNAQQSETND